MLPLDTGATALTFNITETSDFLFRISNLTSINQFLLPVLHPSFKATPQERLVVDIEYEVLDGQKNLLFSDVYTWRHSPSKSLFSSKKSQSIFLPYVFNLKENTFFFAIKLTNPAVVQRHITHFEVSVESNNEEFFYFFLCLKIVLFGLSMLTFTRFFKRYLLQIRQTRETEQKLVLVASILLIAYNFPFNFYLNYVSPSVFLLLISSLVNILFYSYICYIWMVTFEVLSTDHLERQRRIQELRSNVEKGAHDRYGNRRIRHLFMGGVNIRQRSIQRFA